MKNKRLKAILASLVLSTSCFLSAAHAALITLETKNLPAVLPISDFAAAWQADTSLISSTSLSSFTDIRPGGKKFNRLSISFDLGIYTGPIGFQFGLDSGYGSAIYWDAYVGANNDNRWWNGSWADGDGFSVYAPSGYLAVGSSEFQVYWAEGCCNGRNSGRFSLDLGNTWMDLSVANLDAAAVPEPGSLVLLSLGLLGLGVSRKARAKGNS